MKPYKMGGDFKNMSMSDKELLLEYLLQLSDKTEILIMDIERYHSNDPALAALVHDANKAKDVLDKIDKIIGYIGYTE